MSSKNKTVRKRVRRVADLVGDNRQPVAIKPRLAPMKDKTAHISNTQQNKNPADNLPNPNQNTTHPSHTTPPSAPIQHTQKAPLLPSGQTPPSPASQATPAKSSPSLPEKKVNTIRVALPRSLKNDIPSDLPTPPIPPSPPIPLPTTPPTQLSLQPPASSTPPDDQSPSTLPVTSPQKPAPPAPSHPLPNPSEPPLPKTNQTDAPDKTIPDPIAFPQLSPPQVSPFAIFSAGAATGAMLVGLIWLATIAFSSGHRTSLHTATHPSPHPKSTTAPSQKPANPPASSQDKTARSVSSTTPTKSTLESRLDASVALQLVKSWFGSRPLPADESSAFKEATEFVQFVKRQTALPPSSLLAILDEAVKRYRKSLPTTKGALPALEPLFQRVADSELTNLQLSTLHHTFGSFLIAAGEISRAETAFQSALEVSPGFTPALHELFDLARLRGDLQGQIKWGRLMATANPREHALLAEVARLLDTDGKPREAADFLASFPDVIANTPFLAIQHVQLLNKAGASPNDLLQALNPAFYQNPDDLSLAVFRLILLDKAGQQDDVRKALPQCISLINLDSISSDQKTARHALTLASLAWKLTSRKDAETIYNALIASHSSITPYAANDLAYKLIEAGERLDQAEGLVLLALETMPNELAFIDTLASLHLKRGRPDLAVKAFEDRINIAELNHPVASQTLAKALEQIGRKDEANTLRQRTNY